MIKITPKDRQAYGEFNGGQIIENKPIGFPQDGGKIRPYSNLFYWAYAEAKTDSTIGLHPHRGFEIMSFVLKGTIRHFDTKQNHWIPLEAGDAQIIRSGSGIKHAEHMHEGSAMFQIWLDPNLSETMQQEASYSDYKAADFPKKEDGGVTETIYIGKDSPFHLFTKGVTISAYDFSNKATISPDINRYHSIYVQKGAGIVNKQTFLQDAFLQVDNEPELVFEPETSTRLFVISSPKELNYQTYAQIMQAQMNGR